MKLRSVFNIVCYIKEMKSSAGSISLAGSGGVVRQNILKYSNILTMNMYMSSLLIRQNRQVSDDD